MELTQILPDKMFVYPVQRRSPQGRNDYAVQLSSGTVLTANRTFARNARKSYCFPKEGNKIGKIFEQMIDNPFKNDTVWEKYVKGTWRSFAPLKNANQISLQTYLEVMHNVERDTYTTNPSVQSPFAYPRDKNQERQSTFLEQYRVDLNDTTNIFVSTKPEDQIAMLCMKSNGRIANSRTEQNPSIHDFYIGNEFEAVKDRTVKRKNQTKALAQLDHLIDNHGDFTIYQVAIILKLVSGTVNRSVIEDKLFNYLYEPDIKVLRANISKFTELMKGIDTSEATRRLHIMYIIQQALNTKVFSIAKGHYIWHSKKGIDNLHNLGSSIKTIYNMFSTEKQISEVDGENFYNDLIDELKLQGVRFQGK